MVRPLLICLLLALAVPALALDSTQPGSAGATPVSEQVLQSASGNGTPPLQSDDILPDPIRELDEYGDLHDPVLVHQWFEGPQNYLMGIAWDGEYYWTVNGSWDVDGALKYYDEDFNLLGEIPVLLDGRGIVYNPIDEHLYLSTYLGNIYRIDDPFAGTFTQLHSGILQDGQVSLGMSEDGSLLLDFYNGTLQVHDFFSGALIETVTGIMSGSGNFGGGCAIVADTDYYYTVNTNSNSLYVTDFNGDLVETYTIPAMVNGMSLSFTNHLVWMAVDQYGVGGNWYGYSLRDWEEGPVQFHLIPQTVTVPAAGGNVIYDVSLVSELPMTIPGLSFWTKVTLPNGQIFGPLLLVPFTHTPFMQVNVVGLAQPVPGMAPPGEYTLSGYIGIYPNIAPLDDSFDFDKLGD